MSEILHTFLQKNKNLQNRNGVSYMDGSFLDDFGKNSLSRHDALAYFLLNGTSFVAFLEDECPQAVHRDRCPLLSDFLQIAPASGLQHPFQS